MASARAEPGKSGLELRCKDAERVCAVIVSVVLVVPGGVTVVGLKEQDAPAASPEQAKEVTELKPFCGVTAMLTVPCPPDGRVSEVERGGKSEVRRRQVDGIGSRGDRAVAITAANSDGLNSLRG